MPQRSLTLLLVTAATNKFSWKQPDFKNTLAWPLNLTTAKLQNNKPDWTFIYSSFGFINCPVVVFVDNFLFDFFIFDDGSDSGTKLVVADVGGELLQDLGVGPAEVGLVPEQKLGESNPCCRIGRNKNLKPRVKKWKVLGFNFFILFSYYLFHLRSNYTGN